MSFRLLLVLTSVQFLYIGPVFSQLTPPGLDNTQSVMWSALGMQQKFSEQWDMSAYVGGSRESNPHSFAPLHKASIFVLDAGARYHINSKWAIAFHTSYRIQSKYEKEAPYDKASPYIRREMRYYPRLYYKPKLGSINVELSLRPELRTFYTVQGDPWQPADREIRIRLKGKTSLPLNSSHTNQFLLANELLAKSDREIVGDRTYWTDYFMSEDRLSTYFRHTFAHPSLIADFGMMHQFHSDGEYILHLAFDVIIKNPFG